jgi:hypothetical protein
MAFEELVCTEKDEFIAEKVHWLVTLSNGHVVYQDDGRPGLEEPRAWFRLKKYVEANNLAITEFKIQFFTHVEQAAPSGCYGYYFINAVLASAFSEVPDSEIKYYVIGYINDKDSTEVITTFWNVPAILSCQSDVRPYIVGDEKVITDCR